jgi:hypothetical protein
LRCFVLLPSNRFVCQQQRNEIMKLLSQLVNYFLQNFFASLGFNFLAWPANPARRNRLASPPFPPLLPHLASRLFTAVA